MSPYQYARILSLDVAIGSIAGGSLAALICGNLNQMPWSWWIILPLVVWIIYTTDHLLDARRIGPGAATQRHQFHYRHFRILAALVLLAAIATLVLVGLWLPRAIVIGGLILAAAAGLHLVFAQWTGFRLYPAEAVIALLYTIGIWFGPWITAQAVTPEGMQLSAMLFFLSAFANLLVFSLFEREIDARESPNTIVMLFGVRNSEHLLYGTFFFSLLLVGFLIRQSGQSLSVWIVLLLFCAVNLPLAVYQMRGYFGRQERYRAVCDGVFIFYALPALFVLFD